MTITMDKRTKSFLDTYTGGEVVVCACGNLIFPSRKPGRPAKVCEECREATAAHRAAVRVRKCMVCKRFLPKPSRRGRPAHSCPSCLAKKAAERNQINEEKLEEAIERGYCDSRCLYAHEEECRCYCEGAFHMAGWSGLGPVPDRDQS